MDTWSDWLSAHWYQLGVLILLAILAYQGSRAAWMLVIILERLALIGSDISRLRSVVDKWEFSKHD